MKEALPPQSPIPQEYSQDEHGFYNTHVFEQTGEKYRPIDFVTDGDEIEDTHIVVMDSQLVFDRHLHQMKIEQEQPLHVSERYGTTGQSSNTKREVQKTASHRKVFQEPFREEVSI